MIYLFDNGFGAGMVFDPSYLTEEENNKKFQAYSIEEELLLEHFEKDDNMSPNSRMGIVDIINVIVLILPEENRLNINPSKLGKILSRLGYKKVKTNGNFKYCIRRKKQ
jgi:hypothetical protein